LSTTLENEAITRRIGLIFERCRQFILHLGAGLTGKASRACSAHGVAKPTQAVSDALDHAAGWLTDAGYVVEEVELPLL
jgi:hypothetical protein